MAKASQDAFPYPPWHTFPLACNDDDIDWFYSALKQITTMYLKISSKRQGPAADEVVEEIPEDQADKVTRDLKEHNGLNFGSSKIDAKHLDMATARALFAGSSEDDEDADSKKKLRVQRSWQVSPDEFIIKIDASPLHQSAARRMFSRKKAAPPAALEATQEGQEEEEESDEKPSEEHQFEWNEFWGKMKGFYFSTPPAERK